MVRYAASRACFFVVFCSTLLLSIPAAAAPVLSVSPTAVPVQTALGSNAPPQTVRVTNAGSGTLRWSIVAPTFVPAADTPWLTVSPTSGTAAGGGSNVLTLNFSTSALKAAGDYEASFQVAGNTGSPVTVKVTLKVVNPTPLAGIGPQTTIACPGGAIDIWPDEPIQHFVDLYDGGTTFCLRAGTWHVTSSVRPKTGDVFVGQYGAVLDGSNWVTSDDTAAAFRAHNEDIDYVTIRNLVIRKMPQRGIQAFYWMANNWTIENNEIAYNKYGLEFAPNFSIRNNYIHHNVGSPSSSNPAERGGGYTGQRADNTTFDRNEIAYNGPEQKVGLSANVTFTNNFVHHNLGDGIWYDSNTNAGALIEANRVEDNGRDGISFEVSVGAIIRNNTLRRNAGDAVFISMSQNAQIYNNSLDSNFGGIEYFLNCDSLAAGEDVKNNAAFDNTVVVGTQSNTYANGFSSTLCTSAQLTPYLNGSKSLTFSHDTYRVPSLSFTRYFLWGGLKNWNQWQALGPGHDQDGSITAP